MPRSTAGPVVLHREQFGPFGGWRVRLPGDRGIPTPAVSGGRVFVGGGFGSYDFYAFDQESGELEWHRRTKDDGPTAAVVADGFVVFNTESCTLEVVRATDGDVLGERWLGDPLLAQPAVAGGRVFMVYPRNGRHWIGAFHLPQLEPLWETEIGHDAITAPVCAHDRVWVSTFDGSVWCMDAATGHVEWTRRMQATSAPWIHNGEVFVAQRDDHGPQEHRSPRRSRHAGRPRERTGWYGGREGELQVAFEPKPAPYLSKDWGKVRKSAFQADDAAVGFAHAPPSAKLDMASELIGERSVSRTWRFQGSRPVVVDGVLYDTTGDKLEARDLQANEEVWSWSSGNSVEGERQLTPPAVANGRVWAGSWNGSVLGWDAECGRVRWDVPVRAPCHWQPVVSDGWVFAGLEDGTLVGFCTEDKLDDGWPMWGGGPGHNGDPELTAAPLQRREEQRVQRAVSRG